jgi:hypothetical protein
MYVCMYIRVYVYVYVYVYIYIYMYMYVYVLCIYLCMHKHVQVLTRTLKEELMSVFTEEAQIMADLDACEKELEQAV